MIKAAVMIEEIGQEFAPIAFKNVWPRTHSSGAKIVSFR